MRLFERLGYWFVIALTAYCCLSITLELQMLRNNILKLELKEEIHWSNIRRVLTAYTQLFQVKVEEIEKNQLMIVENSSKADKHIIDNIQAIEEHRYSMLSESLKRDSKILDIISEVQDYILPPNYAKLSKINYSIINMTSAITGSGSLIKLKDKYYILTCAHLIDDVDDTMIAKNTVTNKTTFLELIKIDKAKDLALFRIHIEKTEKEIEYIEVAKSIPVVGSHINIIGNPLDYRDILTEGIISKQKEHETFTTASAFLGSSGGAVVYQGKLIGVFLAMYTFLEFETISDSSEFEGLIAYPISYYLGMYINTEGINEFLEGGE